MFGIGIPELAVIALVAILVCGPDKLPALARDAARVVRKLRTLTDSASGDLRVALGADDRLDLTDLTELDPRRLIAAHIREAVATLDAEETRAPAARAAISGDRVANLAIREMRARRSGESRLGAMELIASGRDAVVFAYADGLVLRRNRDGRPAGREAEIMLALAGAGYPVPAVHRATGADLVMERVDGPTLADAMLAARVTVEEGAAVLAALHDRLHAIDAPGDLPVVHLDLHPLNVLLAEHGPVVIDWSNARRGPAGLDVAMTAIILAQLAVVPGMLPDQPELEAGLRAQAKLFLGEFLAAVADSPAEFVDDAVALRREDPNQSEAELAGLLEAATLVRSLQ